MKPIPDCLPGILDMVIDAVNHVSDETFMKRKVMTRVLADLADLDDLGSSPVELAGLCLRTASKAMGVKAVNLSMDTLDRKRFHEITRRD